MYLNIFSVKQILSGTVVKDNRSEIYDDQPGFSNKSEFTNSSNFKSQLGLRNIPYSTYQDDSNQDAQNSPSNFFFWFLDVTFSGFF